MNEVNLSEARKTLSLIDAFGEQMHSLSDADLQNKTMQFKLRLTNGERVEDFLPEAFAVVREASQRTIGLRHYDTQLMGGIILHQRRIAEIGAGEGKTLTATLAAYLNALTGKGVHVVTATDYLATRDATLMGDLYRYLGLSVGVVATGRDSEKLHQAAYAADITYGCSNAFIFDYLRDNIAGDSTDQVQRGLHFAIVDEIDTTFIDESHTPIKLNMEQDSDELDIYRQTIDHIIAQLKPQQSKGGKGDFSVDEKNKRVYLTEAGRVRVETLLQDSGLLKKDESLFNASTRITLLYALNTAMVAHLFYKKDIDYVVRDQQVKVIDKLTRQVVDWRWSEGLHEAIESKENVPVTIKSRALATIAVQNYFRLYEGLSGMSSSTAADASEYQSVYGLEVVTVPMRTPVIRKNLQDLVYLTEQEKFNAVAEDIVHCAQGGDPVVVNCTSQERSEYLAALLRQQGIQCVILNVRQQPEDIERIIAVAGIPGTVTIMTNLSGIGVDIKLSEESIKTGGLYVIGTERSGSRRIDHKLISLSGRRGNPGWSRYYLSLDDWLMRMFNSENVAGLMKRLGMEEGEAIENKWVTKAIGNAQGKTEARSFEIRKQLLEYDDLFNKQRKLIYKKRNEILSTDDVSEIILKMRENIINGLVEVFASSNDQVSQWDISILEQALAKDLDLNLDIKRWLEIDNNIQKETLRLKIIEAWDANYKNKEHEAGADNMRNIEQTILLKLLDEQWQKHLATIELPHQDIRLLEKITPIRKTKGELVSRMLMSRKKAELAEQNLQNQERFIAYAQSIGEQFENTEGKIARKVVEILSRIQIKQEEEVDAELVMGKSDAVEQDDSLKIPEETEATPQHTMGDRDSFDVTQHVSRNASCPCGSGKKYKHCHGALE